MLNNESLSVIGKSRVFAIWSMPPNGIVFSQSDTIRQQAVGELQMP